MRALALLLATIMVPAQAVVPAPPDVMAIESGIGAQFATHEGRTLYIYDKDVEPGHSTCTGKCADAWPPLVASASATDQGEWTIAARPDGTHQWAFRGKPVYAFAQDKFAGATLGDGVQDIWHVAVALAPRPREVMFQGTVHGRVAATLKGRTLYAADHTCTGTCLRTWTPLAAPWAAHAVGAWTVTVRKDDGTQQWAYRGKAVYSNVNDLRPGDMAGEGRDKDWHAIVLQPMPAPPPNVSVGASDYGQIFVDAHGMTLYAIGTQLAEIKRAFCDDACMKKNWTPLLAAVDAKPSGNWGFVDVPEGRQWTYRAEPVFTFNGDKAPSDLNGDKFAVGNGFGGFHVLPQKTLIEETL